MNDAVMFSQDEVLEIREQYVTRIEKLERQNEELELMLRRALNQVRAVDEVMRRASADTKSFEAVLGKLVDECDILAEETIVRPRAQAAIAGTLPKVIVSDLPPAPVAKQSPMRTSRSVFTTQTAPASPAIPPVPPVRLAVVAQAQAEVDSTVSDDMVVEENMLTVIAAKVPMPLPMPKPALPPVGSSPMPGATRSALHALVARAQKSAPSRLRVPA